MMGRIAPFSLLRPESITSMLDLARGTPPGCFVEVGVYKGGSAWYLAKLAKEQGRILHLFDTFTGIPYQGEHDIQHAPGDFGDTSLEAVQVAVPSAIFHQGIFPDTLPNTMQPIAFAHIDCDQYEGIRAAITSLDALMIHNGVMLFDDYGITSGCTKAVNEFFTSDEIIITDQGKAYIVFEGDW